MYTIRNKDGLYFGRDMEWHELVCVDKIHWFTSWIACEQFRCKNIPDVVKCMVMSSHSILMLLITEHDKLVTCSYEYQRNQTVVSNGEGTPSRIDSEGVPRPVV